MVNVEKASGELVPFDIDKLKRSLYKSGANDAIIQMILSEVESELFEGMTTKEIYRKAFSLLKSKSRASAAKYKLKRALHELGPSGYPFEDFVAEILKFQGYRTKVGEIIRGHCVQHEVDIIAERDGEFLIVECKFHQHQDRYCDVKVPLYIHSRYNDLVRKLSGTAMLKDKTPEGWIITNTRFTSDAIQYGMCANLHLVGWDFPKRGSLKERIDISGLHPITCLTTLTKREKDMLLEQEIVLCRDLIQNEKTLKNLRLSEARIKNVIAEAQDVCTPG